MRFSVQMLFVLIFSAPTLAFANADVVVDVTLSPAGSFKAKSSRVTGVALQTPQGVQAENVIVDLNSLNTGISLRDKHMKERLMVDKFPQAKLVKAIGRDGNGVATIEIKGKSQQVKGTYKIDGSTLRAEFPVHLSAIDIKDVRYMGIGVADDVIVHINLPIKEGRAPSASGAKIRK